MSHRRELELRTPPPALAPCYLPVLRDASGRPAGAPWCCSTGAPRAARFRTATRGVEGMERGCGATCVAWAWGGDASGKEDNCFTGP
jgi:hypothetical protein